MARTFTQKWILLPCQREHEIRREQFGVGSHVWGAGGFAAGVVGHAGGGGGADGDPADIWGLRGSAAGVVVVGGLFRAVVLVAKGFWKSGLVAALAGGFGVERLEQTALLFLRSNRSLPTELLPHANLERFAELEEAEKEQELVVQLGGWLLPKTPQHLDSPRAAVRVLCEVRPAEKPEGLHVLQVGFTLNRPRAGEKRRTLRELIELPTRSTHEQELFSPEDWAFLRWLAETYAGPRTFRDVPCLSGIDLLRWVAQWGQDSRLELADGTGALDFSGLMAELVPKLGTGWKGIDAGA
jgi:hypothetical protein